MPKVPVYNQRVEEAGIPSVRQSPEASLGTFGGGPIVERTNQSATDLFKTMGELALKEKQKADEVAVLNADLQLSQRQSQREQETSTMMGRNAFEAPDKVKANWDKDVNEIAGTLSNEEQRMAYRNKSLARSIQLNEYVTKHVTGELNKYDRDTTEAYVSNAQRDASQNAYDPTRIEASLIQQVGALRQYGERTGQSPEQIKKNILDSIQTTHLGVVDRLISNEDFDIAESYLNNTEGNLSGDQVRQAKSLIESGRNKAKEKKKLNDDELEKELFIRTLPDSKNPVTLSELNNLAKSSKIDRPTYDLFVNRLVKVNDDPTIPVTEKTSKLYEIANKFMELNGNGWGNAEVNEETFMPETEAKGNRLDDLKEFRKMVSEAAPYLTKEQERAFYLYTQNDYNESMSAKIGIMKSLMNYISSLDLKSAGVFLTPFLNTLSPSVPVKKSMETAQILKDQAVVTANPKRTAYKVGDIISLPGNRRAKVTGFYPDGEPDVEIVK